MTTPSPSGAASSAPEASALPARDRRGLFLPPSDREIFVVPLAIADGDIDENGHVNNVVYVRWLQDVGTAHWNARFDEATRRRFSWVCLRHEVDYKRALMPGDTVQARTWVGVPNGPRFARFVLIEGPNGVAAQGMSDWCLVDSATMRPVRIPADMIAPFLPRET